jgi:hypothetical protein
VAQEFGPVLPDADFALTPPFPTAVAMPANEVPVSAPGALPDDAAASSKRSPAIAAPAEQHGRVLTAGPPAGSDGTRISTPRPPSPIGTWPATPPPVSAAWLQLIGGGLLLGWAAFLLSVVPPRRSGVLLRTGSAWWRPQHFVEPLVPPG